KVKPEVSTLDFANAVTLQGFRIPALSTRRTETELELNDGQTFAIAGLMNNNITSTLSKIPGIGDIPILGLLFKSKAAQKNQTELVVMITPQILQRTSPGVTPNLPRQQEPYLPPMRPNRTFEPPRPAFTPARGSASAAVPVQPNVSAPRRPHTRRMPRPRPQQSPRSRLRRARRGCRRQGSRRLSRRPPRRPARPGSSRWPRGPSPGRRRRRS